MSEDILQKAEEAVRENRVKLYLFKPSGRTLWIVVGKHGRYLVLPDPEYCTCNDFFFRVLSEEKPNCYHILAVKKAVKEKIYRIVEKEDKLYIKILRECFQTNHLETVEE